MKVQKNNGLVTVPGGLIRFAQSRMNAWGGTLTAINETKGKMITMRLECPTAELYEQARRFLEAYSTGVSDMVSNIEDVMAGLNPL